MSASPHSGSKSAKKKPISAAILSKSKSHSSEGAADKDSPTKLLFGKQLEHAKPAVPAVGSPATGTRDNSAGKAETPSADDTASHTGSHAKADATPDTANNSSNATSQAALEVVRAASPAVEAEVSHTVSAQEAPTEIINLINTKPGEELSGDVLTSPPLTADTVATAANTDVTAASTAVNAAVEVKAGEGDGARAKEDVEEADKAVSAEANTAESKHNVAHTAPITVAHTAPITVAHTAPITVTDTDTATHGYNGASNVSDTNTAAVSSQEAVAAKSTVETVAACDGVSTSTDRSNAALGTKTALMSNAGSPQSRDSQADNESDSRRLSFKPLPHDATGHTQLGGPKSSMFTLEADVTASPTKPDNTNVNNAGAHESTTTVGAPSDHTAPPSNNTTSESIGVSPQAPEKGTITVETAFTPSSTFVSPGAGPAAAFASSGIHEELMEALKENVSLRAELALTRNQKVRYEEQVTVLLGDINDKAREYAALDGKHLVLTQTISASAAKIAALEKQIKGLHDDIHVAEANATAAEARAVGAEARVAQFTESYPTEALLTQTIEALSKQLQQTTAELLASRSALADRGDEFERVAVELARDKHTLKTKENMLMALQADATALRNMLDRTKHTVEDQRAVIAAKEATITSTRKDLEDLRASHESLVRSLRHDTEILQEEAKRMDGTITEARSTISQQEGTIQTLQDTVTQLQAERIQLKDALEQLQNAHRASEAQVDTLQQQLQQVSDTSRRAEALAHKLGALCEESCNSILRTSDEFRSSRTPVVVGRVAADALQALVVRLGKAQNAALREAALPEPAGSTTSPTMKSLLADPPLTDMTTPVPLLSPSALESEPLAEDFDGLMEQTLRLRALYVDTQRALFAARADAAAYERELTALRWRSVTMRVPSEVKVSAVSAVLGEVTPRGELMMRTPQTALEEYNTSVGAARSAAMLTHMPATPAPRAAHAVPPSPLLSHPPTSGNLYLRTSASGIMSGAGRIADAFR